MAERRVRRSRTIQTAAAFTLGAALGSLMALLYAPASGKMTRRRLALKVRYFQKRAVRQLGQTKRILVRKADNVREAATGWISEHLPHGNGRQAPRRIVRHATAR